MEASSPGFRCSLKRSPEKVYNTTEELVEIIFSMSEPNYGYEVNAPPAKRVKVDHQDGAGSDHTTVKASATDPSIGVTPSASSIKHPAPIPPVPIIPHLFHMANAAHQCASHHLQQLLIPASIHSSPEFTSSPIMASYDNAIYPYRPDPLARDKTLGLLPLSLDLLRAGLTSKEISESEQVHFGIEFARVAIKILRASKVALSSKGKEVDRVDCERIKHDAREAVGIALSISRRHTYMMAQAEELELLDIRLLYLEKRPKSARRTAKQLLTTTSSHSHRYSLFLLQLEFGDVLQAGEIFALLDELEKYARAEKHVEITRLACLIRIRTLFRHRKWVDLPQALEVLRAEVDTMGETPSANEDLYAWHANLRLHCTLFRVLWYGRSGNDALAKTLLKESYALMDVMTDDRKLAKLRANGGILKLPIIEGQYILLQSTPMNITLLMTFLVTVVSRRDYLGSETVSKCLVLPRVLRQTHHLAKADDIWDLDFSRSHGIADACEMTRLVMTIRVEVMLEEINALIYRGQGIQAETLLGQAIDLAQSAGVFNPLAPHFCFIYAQFAHLLGRDMAALRSYRACEALLVPGSELGLVVEICRLACQGGFMGLLSDHSKAEKVRSLVERCKASSAASLSATGQFMASLIESNRVASKKKLSNAYQMTRMANNNILRCLIFAFTTSSHLYGAIEALVDQLEAGRHMVSLMGGKERPDGIGQLVLGLWFTEKLKEHYRREGNADKHALAKASQQRHIDRLHEQRNEVTSIPCTAIEKRE